MVDESGAGNPLEPVANLAESVRKLVAPFTDPVLGEIGQYVTDRIKFLRFRFSLRAVERANEMLAEAGQVPQPVDPKILVGVLEGAGLESDPDVIEMWAGLLASAALSSEVLPSFPKILGELSPEEARILEWIISNTEPLTFIDGAPHAVEIPDLRAASGMSSDQYAVRMQNLDRLGLIEQYISGGVGPSEKYAGGSELGSVGLTRLGRALMRACRGPQS